MKVITKQPPDSLGERTRKLHNEVIVLSRLAELYSKLPAWVQARIELPRTSGFIDGKAIMLRYLDGEALGDTHEFTTRETSPVMPTVEDVRAIAHFIHALQENAGLFEGQEGIDLMHKNISNVFKNKYTPDSKNRTSKLSEFMVSDLSQDADLYASIVLMTKLSNELGQYEPMYPETDPKRVIAHANLNPSSFMWIQENGKLAIVDWNRLSLSNNFAFDASTVIVFLTPYPELQKAFLEEMKKLESDKGQFMEHLRVDLLYNRIPGELLHMTNKLFAAIKARKPLQTIQHYKDSVNQLFTLLNTVHKRQGIFA